MDYGPFGFLDAFDPNYTPNTTDMPGRRYRFANQPDACLWNVAQFATSLSAAELISDDEANLAMERSPNVLWLLFFSFFLTELVFWDQVRRQIHGGISVYNEQEAGIEQVQQGAH